MKLMFIITEDEHDVCWFRLEKGKPHECPVCTQYFMVTFMPLFFLFPYAWFIIVYSNWRFAYA